MSTPQSPVSVADVPVLVRSETIVAGLNTTFERESSLGSETAELTCIRSSNKESSSQAAVDGVAEMPYDEHGENDAWEDSDATTPKELQIVLVNMQPCWIKEG